MTRITSPRRHSLLCKLPAPPSAPTSFFRPPLPPPPPSSSSRSRVLASTIRVTDETFLCRFAVASSSTLCLFRISTSAPSFTRRNNLPIICAASRYPSSLMPNASSRPQGPSSSPTTYTVNRRSLTPVHLPKHHPPRHAPLPCMLRSSRPISCFCVQAYQLSECALRDAST